MHCDNFVSNAVKKLAIDGGNGEFGLVLKIN